MRNGKRDPPKKHRFTKAHGLSVFGGTVRKMQHVFFNETRMMHPWRSRGEMDKRWSGILDNIWALLLVRKLDNRSVKITIFSDIGEYWSRQHAIWQQNIGENHNFQCSAGSTRMRKYLSVFWGVSLAVAHIAPGEFQAADENSHT